MPRRTEACALGDGFNVQGRLGQQFAGYSQAQAMQIVQRAGADMLLKQARQVATAGTGQGRHTGDRPGFTGRGGDDVCTMHRRVR